MIIRSQRLAKTDSEKRFAAWLTTQKNANGQLFLSYIATRYAQNLRTEPPKLDVSLSLSERDVYRYHTVAEFDELNRKLREAPNFNMVNREAGHGALSAALAAYRRYVQYIEVNGEPDIRKLEATVTQTPPANRIDTHKYCKATAS